MKILLWRCVNGHIQRQNDPKKKWILPCSKCGAWAGETYGYIYIGKHGRYVKMRKPKNWRVQQGYEKLYGL